MLNEGLDEDTIISVLSNFVNEEEENVKYSNSLSESCFNDIINIVEALLFEGRLVDDNGNRTDAFYELKDKVLKTLPDKKATSSATRKHYQKQAKAYDKEEKRVAKEELPQAEHNKRNAWGYNANAQAHYNHYANKENPSASDKQAAENWKSIANRTAQDDEKAYQNLQNVKRKIVDASWNKHKKEDQARKEQLKTNKLSNLMDRITNGLY